MMLGNMGNMGKAFISGNPIKAPWLEGVFASKDGANDCGIEAGPCDPPTFDTDDCAVASGPGGIEPILRFLLGFLGAAVSGC